MEKQIEIIGNDPVRLARPIGIKNCFVSVVDASLPKEYFNIKDCVIHVKTAEGWVSKSFPGGYYEDLTKLVNVLQHLIEKKNFTVTYDSNRMRVAFKAENDRLKMQLPFNIARLLNMPQIIRGNVISERRIKLTTHHFHVLCDFVEPTVVNGGSERILAVVHNNCIKYEPATSLMLKVTENVIENVQLRIVDDNGDRVDFVAGESCIILKFVHK